MSSISTQYREVMNDIMSYTSAVAHGKSARKVEKRRQEMLLTIKDAQKKISALQPFEGDKSLRDSAVAYLRISYHVLNDDYGKIVNMEEVAEQSYDAMEAYLLAQEKADEKLKKAGDQLDITEHAFAEKHNIKLIETEDELSSKMKEAGKVNHYHRAVYLIFFKSHKQEMYLVEAVQQKNVNSIEQNKNTLLKYADEGLAKLDTMKDYKGDKSLLVACRNALEFHKLECKDKIPVMTGHMMKQENFEKMKKAFDAKKDKKQEDVDKFNAAVNDLNKSVADYNTTNDYLNTARGKVVDGWNKASTNFLDKHTPKYK